MSDKKNEDVENIIFKNKKEELPKEEKPKKQEEKKEIVTNEEPDDNKKKKLFYLFIKLVVILLIILVFSTIFAMLQGTKNTIASGVSIKNVDVSKLTYEEAKKKLENILNIEIGASIDLKYNDYLYTMKSDEISLAYNISDVLDEAYGIGRNQSIIKNNYSLLATAFSKRNIDYKLTFNEQELDKVIEHISASVPGLTIQYSYYIEENELIINPGTDGIQVDKEELKNRIKNNILNRNAQEISKKSENFVIEIPYKNVLADKIDIDKIYNEVHKEPKNASYTPATDTTDFVIYPDADGIDFAISIDEAKNIVEQEGLTEYVIPLNRKKADIQIKDIGIEAFPYTISSFPTKYDASNTNRSKNLEIAASKINGTVLLPGEKFSFNAVVGERTVAEGYKDAKIYADGQVVDGLAGGICQISSTLYNAVLQANLQVDERYNHTFTTSYVPVGRDATVVYGVKDFKFTNNRNYPIKIGANVANGVVEFTIYGFKEENEYEVRILPVTTETTPFTVNTIVDQSMPSGSSYVLQAGTSGCRVTTYKEVLLNGAVISKEVISNDVYKPLTKVIKTGPQVQ